MGWKTEPFTYRHTEKVESKWETSVALTWTEWFWMALGYPAPRAGKVSKEVTVTGTKIVAVEEVWYIDPLVLGLCSGETYTRAYVTQASVPETSY